MTTKETFGRHCGTDPQETPGLVRSTLLAIGAGFAVLILAAAPLPGPPAADEIGSWWADLGTATATMAVIRGIGIVVAMWLVLLAVLGIAVSITRSAFSLTLWQRVTPATVRRALLTSVAAITVSLPGVAHANNDVDPPMLHDLGPADVAGSGELEVPVLRDLGPHPGDRPATEPRDPESTQSSSDAAPATTVVDTWTVAPGDHLWRIAEETLLDRGQAPTTSVVEDYWRRLIDENRAVIGDDIDLIHPGLVLSLPGER